MTDKSIYPVFDSIKKDTHLNKEQYQQMYERSISDPNGFWAEQAEQNLDWFEKWQTVSDTDFDSAKIKWFEGGKLNVSYNCIDRHLESRADQVAIIWEGDDPSQSEKITYQQLHDKVCQLSNAMLELGIEKATVFAFTCQWFRKPFTLCWLVRELAPSTPSCLAGSRPRHCVDVLMIPNVN